MAHKASKKYVDPVTKSYAAGYDLDIDAFSLGDKNSVYIPIRLEDIGTLQSLVVEAGMLRQRNEAIRRLKQPEPEPGDPPYLPGLLTLSEKNAIGAALNISNGGDCCGDGPRTNGGGGTGAAPGIQPPYGFPGGYVPFYPGGPQRVPNPPGSNPGYGGGGGGLPPGLTAPPSSQSFPIIGDGSGTGTQSFAGGCGNPTDDGLNLLLYDGKSNGSKSIWEIYPELAQSLGPLARVPGIYYNAKDLLPGLLRLAGDFDDIEVTVTLRTGCFVASFLGIERKSWVWGYLMVNGVKHELEFSVPPVNFGKDGAKFSIPIPGAGTMQIAWYFASGSKAVKINLSELRSLTLSTQLIDNSLGIINFFTNDAITCEATVCITRRFRHPSAQTVQSINPNFCVDDATSLTHFAFSWNNTVGSGLVNNGASGIRPTITEVLFCARGDTLWRFDEDVPTPGTWSAANGGPSAWSLSSSPNTYKLKWAKVGNYGDIMRMVSTAGTGRLWIVGYIENNQFQLCRKPCKFGSGWELPARNYA